MLDHVFDAGAGATPASTDGSTAGPELDDEWDSLTSIPSMRSLRSSVTAVRAAKYPGLDVRCKT